MTSTERAQYEEAERKYEEEYRKRLAAWRESLRD